MDRYGTVAGGCDAVFRGDGQQASVLAMPAGQSLFRIVPFCSDNLAADADRLMALRGGARLGETRLAHPALPAACAQALDFGLHAPMVPGETRLFLPEAAAAVHAEALGRGVVCGPQMAGLVCHLAG